MFYYISGALAHLEHGFAVVDAGGVGYKLTITETAYNAMPPHLTTSTPPNVKLYTHMAVREDGVELFGFISSEELSAFRMLLSVSGVGPKAAISILSLLSPEKFALAVCTEDRKTISKASGIGPKTAARIVLELKDKLMKNNSMLAGTVSDSNSTSPASVGKLGDVLDALSVLGYTRAEALNALKSIDTATLSTESIIKEALKKLVRNF